MALKIDRTYPRVTTVKVNDAVISTSPEQAIIDTYARVEFMAGTKATQRAEVAFYDFTNRAVLLEQRTFHGITLDLGGSNFVTQIYEALKALPEFSGAEDA
jgi:hypothetical protein